MIVWGIYTCERGTWIAVVDSNSQLVLRTVHGAAALPSAELVDAALAASGGNRPTKIFWAGLSMLERVGCRIGFLPLNRPRQIMRSLGLRGSVHAVDCARALANGAFFTSGAKSATVLAVAVEGSRTTAHIWLARGKRMNKLFTERAHAGICEIYSTMCRMIGVSDNNARAVREFADPSSASADLVHYLVCSHFTDEYSVSMKWPLEASVLDQDLYLSCLKKTAPGQRVIAATVLSLIDVVAQDLIKTAGDITDQTTLCLAAPAFMFDRTDNYLFNNIIRANPDVSAVTAIGAAAAHLQSQLTTITGAHLRTVK